MKLISFSCVLITILFINVGYAKQKTIPIYIKSNSAEFNLKTGARTYRGDVKVSQGATHLQADVVSLIASKHNQAEQLIAKGKPARFITQQKKHELPFHASANTIKYDIAKQQITLLHNGKVKQGRNSLIAPHIVYDVKSKKVTVTASKKNKTVIIVQPNKIKKHAFIHPKQQKPKA